MAIITLIKALTYEELYFWSKGLLYFFLFQNKEKKKKKI